MHTDDPYHDPKPTQVPVIPIPPIDWRKAGERLLNAVLGAVAGVLLTWLAPFVRPPATAVDPSAPTAVQAVKGSQAAAVLTDIGLLDEQP
jgi:hypothetical protein